MTRPSILIIGFVGLVMMAVACAPQPRRSRHPVVIDASDLIPRVYFPFDDDRVAPQDLEVLRQNLSWLQKYDTVVVIVEGHTDRWGSDDYNIELGDRRARFVKAYLVQNGILDERVVVVSFGKNRPIDTSDTPEGWARNRRVEFVVR